MSQKIRVNWTNPKFSQKTYNKQADGLGSRYETETGRQFSVVFTIDTLNDIKTSLDGLINLWTQLGPTGVKNKYQSQGESDSGAMVRGLKRELNRILFNSKLTNVYSYFPFSDNLASNKSRTAILAYMLDIVRDYRDITLSILNVEEGLSEYVGVGTQGFLPPLVEVPNSKTSIIVNTNVIITKLQVPLLDTLISASNTLIAIKTQENCDLAREYKTVLNFGNDSQYLVEAWRAAPTNTNNIQLKLLRPLDNTVELYDTAFISREAAKTVIDNSIKFELAPEIDRTPYLRPYNLDVNKFIDNKKVINNASLQSLGLDTGSAGAIVQSNISYGDQVFRRWFTNDFTTSELNIDFTDYKNFVQFSSAYERLVSFAEKLSKIEELNTTTKAHPASSTVGQSLKAIEKENIIRNFDPYEQFLYYATQSVAYSASVDYVEGGLEYNATGSWPKKSDGTLYSPTSSITASWLPTQLSIALRYDESNQNYLQKQIPQHVQNDANSTNFITLISMFGHFLDNIKVYVDQFPNIYSTNPDPFKELTMDQVYEVAKSFGLALPNAYSLENLQTFISSIAGDSGSRSNVAETWKRFLHSAIYLTKTKGSRTSLDAVLNTYGINSPILQVKETTYPTQGNYIQSDELTYGLRFTTASNNRVRVPFVSSSITAKTLQLCFNPILRQTSSLLTGDDKWGFDLIPHPSASVKPTYGRINIVSGSTRTIIATSSYFPLFSDDYTNIMLRSQSADITIIQTDGDQILFQESASVSIPNSVWNSTTYVYVGGSGSIKTSANFDGIVDEIRVWGENISDDDFVSQAYDPGSYYGGSYTSSYANLYVHIPFSKVELSVTSSVTNESPYENISIVPVVSASGFTTASYTRVLRSIKQFTPIVGSTIYTNKKVTVAPPPMFSGVMIDDNGTVVLNLNRSSKEVEDKQYTSGQNIVSFGISPTDFTNQTILRTMGVVDVNNIIGSPRYVSGSSYSTLVNLKNTFVEHYNKTVNPNEYIRFFKDLVQAPSEYVEDNVPARTKLLNGVVIESSILDRNKSFINRSFKVSGDDTKLFDAYISGSGSAEVGAYTFDATYNMELQKTFSGDILPISGTLDFYADVEILGSTNPTLLPPARKFTQYLNNFNTASLATSSIQDTLSSVDYLEAYAIQTIPEQTASIGYARTPYLGITDRLPSELNTLTPYYNIQPRSDLWEIGTTTYFHKQTGIYSFDIYTLYKRAYLTKLDTQIDSPIDKVYAPITLLPTGSIVSPPGRFTQLIPEATYGASSYTTGVIKFSNIFSMFGIYGVSGLRFRMYRTIADRDADASRPFSTIPTGSHGVLFDGLLDGQQDIAPPVLVQTQNEIIYYTVNNLTTSAITSHIDIDYFVYEPADLIPLGYLPRHYKFSRDNGTALKRRNYLGCRQINTTIDGQLPFEITVTTGNTIYVNQSTTTTGTSTGAVIPSTSAIKTGGSGKLSVE